MSEKALAIIKAAKENQITMIELRNCDLTDNSTDVWEALLELKSVEFLSIISNEISDVSILANLPNIQNLYLTNNKISDISPLAKCYRLKSLDVSYNNIVDISSLEFFPKLHHLYLVGNKVENIKSISYQTELTHLNLNSNKIVDISPIYQNRKLQYLYLGYNNISNLNILSNNAELKHLELNNNEIIDISPLKELSNLITLNLAYNRINDIRPLGFLLENNIIYSASGSQLGYRNVELNSNPLTMPPNSIVKMGNAAIINYFKQIDKQGGTVPLHEAKLLIVGEPGAGKTTLLKKIINPDFQVPNEETKSTVGINVFEGWLFEFIKEKTCEFKTNIWDFGGQEIQYMTHQFFLTPSSLYVLIADDRKQNTNFPYWFESIQLFGKEGTVQSPILVVLNENKHKSISNFDYNSYKIRYPKIQIKLCEVDFSINDKRFSELREVIKQMLTELPHVGYPLPKQWIPIREKLRRYSVQYNHISENQFSKICNEFSVTSPEDQFILSSYLHKLGTILHFQNDFELRDFIILNPTWAVKAVYSVLENTDVKKRYGKFDWTFLDSIWTKYEKSERSNLLNLMKKNSFEICYEISKDNGQFIAPQLLENIKPIYKWNSVDSLKFKFEYKFMPKGIITRLIVRLNEDIAIMQNSDSLDDHEFVDIEDHKDYLENESGGEIGVEEEKKYLVWQSGVVLDKSGCRAQIIQYDFPEQSINIEISGNIINRKHCMRWVRDEIDSIHKKWFQNIEVKKLVPCICERCKGKEVPFYHDFIHLHNRLEKGKIETGCGFSGDDVNIVALLEGIFLPKDNVPEYAMEIIRNLEILNRGQNQTNQKLDFIISDYKYFNHQIQHELKIIFNYLDNAVIDSHQSHQLITEITKTVEQVLSANPNIKAKKVFNEVIEKRKDIVDIKSSLCLTIPIIPYILEAKFEGGLDLINLYRDKKVKLEELWEKIKYGIWF